MGEAEHVVLAEDDTAAGAEDHRLADTPAVDVAQRTVVRKQHHHPLPEEKRARGEGVR